MFISKHDRYRYLGFDDRWAMLLGIPLLSGMAFLLFSGAQKEVNGSMLIICYFVGMLHTTIYWLVNRRIIVELRKRWPQQEDAVRRVVTMIGLATLFAIVFERIAFYIINRWYYILIEFGWGNESIIFKFSVAITLCLLVLSVYESIYFFSKYRHSMLEREKLAKANMQAQLATLKEQVNPHFLFNSLNTLTSLIPEDSHKATLFTQRLAAVYRRILEYRHQELIPLEEELTALEDYIFLMQTRFETKLNVVIDRGGQAQVQGQLVPLCLQLLVENAIKHNVVSDAHPLLIRIVVKEDEISVTNNRNPRRRRLSATGWGLHSIQQRLRMVTERPMQVEATDTTYRVVLPLIALPVSSLHATA